MAPKKVTPEQIAQVRAEVLKMYEASKEMYEESDIARLKSEDLLVERYITREQGDVLGAIEVLNGAFRFGKRQGIGKIAESEFSPELLALIQFQGKDKAGNKTVYIRYKTAKKILKRNSKDQEKLKRLALYNFKRVEDDTKGKNTIVVDCRSLAIRDLVKYANKDLAAVAGWLITMTIRYSPDQIGSIYFYEIPRFFAAIAERVVKLIPDEYSSRVKLVRKKDIEKLIAKEELPDYMGGKLTLSAKGVPADDEDSGDEGNEITNLEDMEKALEEEENTKV